MRFVPLFICLLTTSLAAPVTYKLSGDGTRLTATTAGKTVTLIDMAKKLPKMYFQEGANPGFDDYFHMYDLIVRDFDSDGTSDALISFSGGGNCCAPSYVFVTYKPGNVLRISNSFDSWATPSIETFNGKLVAKVRDEQSGTITRYAFNGTKAIVADQQPIPELTALAEMRIESFNPARPTLAFNLDGGSQKETMTCSVWDRWNTLMCSIKDSKGKELFPNSLGCDRYGILPTKTNGYNDLVCGYDTVGRWNGKTWVFPDNF